MTGAHRVLPICYANRRHGSQPVLRSALLTILCALLLPVAAPAQPAACDAQLRAPTDHPYGYRLRNDRCEGVYVQEVGLATLLVASLTETYEDFDPRSGAGLRLSWSGPRDTEVWLRAHSLRRRFYYRMDALRPAGTTAYLWPTGLLAGLDLRRPELGVLAWVQHPLGGEERRVYLPLRIQQQAQPARSGRYQLVLVPGRELQEVFLWLAQVGEGGTLRPFIRAGEALAYGYYPADRGIAILLPPLAEPGIYYLELAAELASGAVITTTLHFYHDGG